MYADNYSIQNKPSNYPGIPQVQLKVGLRNHTNLKQVNTTTTTITNITNTNKCNTQRNIVITALEQKHIRNCANKCDLNIKKQLYRQKKVKKNCKRKQLYAVFNTPCSSQAIKQKYLKDESYKHKFSKRMYVTFQQLQQLK